MRSLIALDGVGRSLPFSFFSFSFSFLTRFLDDDIVMIMGGWMDEWDG